MSHHTHASTLLGATLLFGFVAALGSAALGQYGPPAQKAADPNLREVSMVRQDESDCQDGNVSGGDPSIAFGSRMPCQCTAVGSAMPLITRTRSSSPRRTRKVGPGTMPS